MPAAFNNNIIRHLTDTVRTLYYRRKKVGKLHLTYEEYIDTFVPYEVRDVFRQAAPYVYVDRRQHRWELLMQGDHSIEKINATLEMRIVNVVNGYPPPVTKLLMMQNDAPPEVIARIRAWAERGGDASREFGRVNKVLDILNQNFSRVAIRYYWPTILALCSEGHHTKELVQEMQDLKMPARLKQLPVGLPAACRLTAETIATTRLIPVDIEEDETGEVVIDIVSGQTYNEGFGTFHGLS